MSNCLYYYGKVLWKLAFREHDLNEARQLISKSGQKFTRCVELDPAIANVLAESANKKYQKHLKVPNKKIKKKSQKISKKYLTSNISNSLIHNDNVYKPWGFLFRCRVAA